MEALSLPELTAVNSRVGQAFELVGAPLGVSFFKGCVL